MINEAKKILEKAKTIEKTSEDGYVKVSALKETLRDLGEENFNRKAKRAELIQLLEDKIIELTNGSNNKETVVVEPKRPNLFEGKWDKNKRWFYLLIAGSRSYDDMDTFDYIVDNMLSEVSKECNILIVSGGATGADILAEIYAKKRGYSFALFPADGKSAGFKRNEEMHDYLLKCQRRGCLCFWNGYSKDTQHNFELAKKRETPLKVFNYTLRQFIKI